MIPGIPDRRDPRWASVAILSTFTVLGQTVLHFAVSPLDIAVSVATAAGLDAVAAHRRSGTWAVPFSALITGLSIGLLLRSDDVAVFVVAAIAAVGSKHLVRRADGAHVFNPSNAGIVVALLFTQGLSMVTPGQWGGSALVALMVCGVGAFVVFRVRRLALVGTYLVAHVGLAAATGTTLALGSLAPASVLVFCFFMITDPKTAPRSRPAQVAYAVLVAGIGQALTSLGAVAAPYLALVVVCAAVPLLERLTHSHAPSKVAVLAG